MHMLSRDMIDCGSPTSETSKTYQRSGTTNWGPRQCRLIRMLNVRGTWVGKMALFGGSQYAPMILGMSLRLLRPLIGMAAPTVLRFLWHTEGLLFFLGGGTKVFYIFNILDALYKLDTYYNMFDHVWRVLEGFPWFCESLIWIDNRSMEAGRFWGGSFAECFHGAWWMDAQGWEYQSQGAEE